MQLPVLLTNSTYKTTASYKKKIVNTYFYRLGTTCLCTVYAHMYWTTNVVDLIKKLEFDSK